MMSVLVVGWRYCRVLQHDTTPSDCMVSFWFLRVTTKVQPSKPEETLLSSITHVNQQLNNAFNFLNYLGAHNLLYITVHFTLIIPTRNEGTSPHATFLFLFVP